MSTTPVTTVAPSAPVPAPVTPVAPVAPTTPAPTTPAPTFSDLAAAVLPFVALQVSLATAVQAQVKSTTGVTAINSYSSSLNTQTNMLTVDLNVQGPDGALAISTSISVAGGFGNTPFGEDFGE